MNVYRIVDANINRVSEGIRVLEDISRYIFENKEMTGKLRELRHQVRKGFIHQALISSRDSLNDIGYSVSISNSMDRKENIEALIQANFKRLQEGLRSIEETLKIMGYYMESKTYESFRYWAYDLEKQFPLRKYFLETDIYGITGEEFSEGRDNVQTVKEMIEADIKIIQYRDKNKNKLTKYNECKVIRELTRRKGVTFIVNDDVDIALAVKADGVHVGQEDMPVKEVKKIAGDMVVGVSTHNKEQAKAAVESGADYIGVGPVFQTATKRDVESSEGLKYLEWVAENINLPHVAIGGIHATNILQVKERGGRCFAMISEIAGAKDIRQKVREIRALLK